MIGLLDIYRRLYASDLDEALVPHLASMKRLSPIERAPLFDALLACEPKHPDYLAAFLPLFGGGREQVLLQSIVRGLYHDRAEVRKAAVRALAASAVLAPHRFVHALYAEREDVRAWALALKPPSVGLSLMIPLLSRPEHIEQLSSLGPQLVARRSDLQALLQAWQDGHVCGETARKLLDGPDPLQLLKERIGLLKGNDNDVHGWTPEEMLKGLNASSTDPLDQLLHLHWNKEGNRCLDALIELVDTELRVSVLLRVGWSMVRLILRASSHRVDLIAAAAAIHPALLYREELNVAERLAAAKILHQRTVRIFSSDPVSPLWKGKHKLPGLEREPSAALGLLSLCQHPQRLMFGLAGEQRWLALFLAAPQAACKVVRRIGFDEAPRSLIPFVQGLFERIWTLEDYLNLTLELLAFWQTKLVGPPRPRFFERMVQRSNPPVEVQALLNRAKDLDRSGRLIKASGPRRRLVMAFLELLGPSGVHDLIVKADFLDEQGRNLELEILGAAWGAMSIGVLEAAFQDLTESCQRKVVQALDRIPGLGATRADALGAAALASPHASVRTEAEILVPKSPSEPERMRLREHGATQPLTRGDRSQILGIDLLSLGTVLLEHIEHGRSGLAPAVLARSDPPWPDPRICAWLILADEDPVEASQAILQFWQDENAEETVSLLVEKGAHRERSSFLTAACLFRWDRPFSRFERSAKEHGILTVQTIARSMEVAWIGEQIYRALARLAVRWRIRKYSGFETAFGGAVVERAVSDLAKFAVPASSLLLELSLGGFHANLLEAVQIDAQGWLDVLEEEARQNLARWLKAPPSPKPKRGFPPPPTQVEPQTLRDWGRLACSSGKTDVERALSHLFSFGASGLNALLEAVREHSVGRVRAVALGVWLLAEENWAWLESELCPNVQVELQFEVALLALESGYDSWDAVERLIDQPDQNPWLRPTDLERCLACDIKPSVLARAVLQSPHTAASTLSVKILLDVPLDDEIQSIFRTFICQDNRPLFLRRRIAEHLLCNEDFYGAPLVTSSVLEAWLEDRGRPTLQEVQRLLRHNEPMLTRAVLGLGLAQAVEMYVHKLEQLEPSEEKSSALLSILKEASSERARTKALRLLPYSATRQPKLKRLARIFAWGYRESRLLTGAEYTIRLLGSEALGFTRLHERSIYVNPLAFFRGEQDGEAILRGLIVHEIGHHIYHSDAQGMEVWKRAHEQGCEQLLNLVMDEHLERNLRTRSKTYGHDLQKLAAHAFQHAERALPVEFLLTSLGQQAGEVLCTTRLEVARDETQIRIDLGELYKTMERSGSSFSRFVRALRMGLGNRYQDPKVEEALALFRGPEFRSASMEELWTITQELLGIFGIETSPMQLMDLHATVDGDEPSEIDQEGIDDPEVQKEVRRILKSELPERSQDRGSGPGLPPMVLINDDQDDEFDEIKRVEPIAADPQLHRDAVRTIARPARVLRQKLSKLGLQLLPSAAGFPDDLWTVPQWDKRSCGAILES